MKNFIRLIDAFLTAMVRSNRGKLFIDPFSVAAIIGGAAKIGTKIFSDIKAKKQTKKLEAERKQEMAENKRLSERGLNVAKGIARMGDTQLAQKRRDIEEAASNAVGKVTASSGSTQEIINAVQGIQKSKTRATGAAESEAGQFKAGAARYYADKFSEAGRQRILGEGAIDRRTQMALGAIQQQAQSNVDTASNLSQMGMDYGLYRELKTGKLSPDQYNVLQGNPVA